MVDSSALAACFEAHNGILEDFVKEPDKVQPLCMVCSDAGLQDSTVKFNVELISKHLSPATAVKCI